MKKREKQKQKQAEDEKLRQAQHIFGPLEKIKAAIRSRRQRKAEQRAMLLAAPADDEWLDEDEEETGGSNDGQDETTEVEDTVQASPQERPVRNDSAGDDEYPGLSS